MRIAVVQSDVAFSDPTANVCVLSIHLRELKQLGAELVVFPEAFLTGYCVSTAEEAKGIALCDVVGPDHPLANIQTIVDELDLIVIVGFAEQSTVSGVLWNTAALFESGRPMQKYRKTHLPELGYDKFVTPGEELPVFETRLGRIGILICFDLRHPEAARVLALRGADLIVLPTNWPEGAEIASDLYPLVRASENKVFIVTCNRVGREGGFGFIGRSKIVDPYGKVLASAADGEEVLVADINLESARDKRTVIIPESYAITVFESRRPDLYSPLTDS